jgi:hypothetical protein
MPMNNNIDNSSHCAGLIWYGILDRATIGKLKKNIACIVI